MSPETVSVIASSVVAVAAIIAAAVQHSRTLKHSRQLADLQDVRQLLDPAAVVLHRAAYCLDEVRSWHVQYGRSAFSNEKGGEIFSELGTIGEEVDSLTERLAIRFGRRHRVVRLFADADDAYLAIYRAVGLLRLEGSDVGDDPRAIKHVEDLNDRKREEITEKRNAYDEARALFVEAASKAAGAQL